MTSPTQGDKAPDFALATEGGGTVSLRDFRGRKLVLYFYPADDTSGCTLEAIDFTKSAKAFAEADTAVVGVSPDTQASHDRFKAKYELAVQLAADPDKTAINAYGVWVEKSMYGRKYMGVERATFLIGPDGRIVREWRKVRVKGHVDQVLEAARGL
jgi:thioredoxin-dependent peroxiredoxin